MKLIDADKLLRFFTVDTANQTYRFGTIKKQIENAETVEAITIPDNATNGNIMKNTFPNVPVKIFEDMNTVIFGNAQFDLAWWNAPYERM